jgi:hypothetical protein
MSVKRESRAADPKGKAEWRRPKVEELGNLKDFVRSGHAFGKSGTHIDGSSSGNDETKN